MTAHILVNGVCLSRDLTEILICQHVNARLLSPPCFRTKQTGISDSEIQLVWAANTAVKQLIEVSPRPGLDLADTITNALIASLFCLCETITRQSFARGRLQIPVRSRRGH